jgi:hypothetical protein
MNSVDTQMISSSTFSTSASSSSSSSFGDSIGNVHSVGMATDSSHSCELTADSVAEFQSDNHQLDNHHLSTPTLTGLRNSHIHSISSPRISQLMLTAAPPSHPNPMNLAGSSRPISLPTNEESFQLPASVSGNGDDRDGSVGIHSSSSDNGMQTYIGQSQRGSWTLSSFPVTAGFTSAPQPTTGTLPSNPFHAHPHGGSSFNSFALGTSRPLPLSAPLNALDFPALLSSHSLAPQTLSNSQLSTTDPSSTSAPASFILRESATASAVTTTTTNSSLGLSIQVPNSTTTTSVSASGNHQSKKGNNSDDSDEDSDDALPILPRRHKRKPVLKKNSTLEDDDDENDAARPDSENSDSDDNDEVVLSPADGKHIDISTMDPGSNENIVTANSLRSKPVDSRNRTKLLSPLESRYILLGSAAHAGLSNAENATPNTPLTTPTNKPKKGRPRKSEAEKRQTLLASRQRSKEKKKLQKLLEKQQQQQRQQTSEGFPLEMLDSKDSSALLNMGSPIDKDKKKRDKPDLEPNQAKKRKKMSKSSLESIVSLMGYDIRSDADQILSDIKTQQLQKQNGHFGNNLTDAKFSDHSATASSSASSIPSASTSLTTPSPVPIHSSSSAQPNLSNIPSPVSWSSPTILSRMAQHKTPLYSLYTSSDYVVSQKPSISSSSLSEMEDPSGLSPDLKESTATSSLNGKEDFQMIHISFMKARENLFHFIEQCKSLPFLTLYGNLLWEQYGYKTNCSERLLKHSEWTADHREFFIAKRIVHMMKAWSAGIQKQFQGFASTCVSITMKHHIDTMTSFTTKYSPQLLLSNLMVDNSKSIPTPLLASSSTSSSSFVTSSSSASVTPSSSSNAPPVSSSSTLSSTSSTLATTTPISSKPTTILIKPADTIVPVSTSVSDTSNKQSHLRRKKLLMQLQAYQ